MSKAYVLYKERIDSWIASLHKVWNVEEKRYDIYVTTTGDLSLAKIYPTLERVEEDLIDLPKRHSDYGVKEIKMIEDK